MSKKMSNVGYSIKEPLSPVKQSKSIKYPIIYDEFDNLAGKLLTVIDAVIADKEQCKAVKDLIRDKVYEKREWFRELCYRDDLPMSSDYAKNIIS